MSTRRKAMLAALAVVVVGGGVIWFTTGNDPERAGPPLTAPTGAAKPSTSSTTAKAKPKTTPTTKATTTPTNEVSEPGESGQQPAQTAEAVGPRSNPGPFQVATAKVPSVEAQLAAPTGVEAKPAVTTGRPAFAGNQQGAQPLPRIEQPVEGRFATATGYRFENPQPFGDALTFLVVQRSGDWVQVQLPVRPNGTTAWVRASDVTLGEVPGHVEVNLAQRTLRVFEGSTLTAETPVATTESPSPTPSLSATVEPSTSETPSPLASRTSVKSKSPYCQAYQTILDTAPTTESSDEEGSADLKKLSATYAALITKYSAAAELAPASLKDDYAKVIRYLKDFKITVDSGDWNAVRAQLAVLFKIELQEFPVLTVCLSV